MTIPSEHFIVLKFGQFNCFAYLCIANQLLTTYAKTIFFSAWVTASGDRINYDKLKNYQIRWVALSHDMFNQHGFRLGDVIIVESDSNPAINGEWVVKDKMGKRLRKRIDFLTPRGDKYNFRNGAVTIRKKK